MLPGWARAALVAALAVGAAALVAGRLGATPGKTVRAALGVKPWAIAGCLASAYVVLALQALRWYSVMRPLLGLQYRDALRAQLVGALFNAVLPLRAGDLLRVQYLGRRTGKSRATILGTEIIDRWIDWWGWIPTFILVCLLGSPPPWLYRALLVFGAALAATAGGMVALTRPGMRSIANTRFGRTYRSFQAGIDAIRSRRVWQLAFLVGPLCWIWETLALTVLGRGLGVDLTLIQAFSLMVGFNLAMVVPSPGSVGAVEAGGTAALMFFGVDQSLALAFMCVYHLTQLVPGMVGGALVLGLEGGRLLVPRPDGTPDVSTPLR